jgi:hypothetical protein
MMEGKRDGAQSDQADAATANNPEKANDPNNRRKPNVPPKVLCSKGCGKEYLVSRRSLAHRLTHEEHCLGPLPAPKKAATAPKAAAKPADSFSDNKRKAPPLALKPLLLALEASLASVGLARGRGVKAAHAAETVSTCTSGSEESSDSSYADRYGQLEKKVKAEGKKRKRVEDLQQETATKVLMLEEQVKCKAGLVASPDGLTQHLQAFRRAQQPVFAVLRQVVSSVLASPVASATSSVSSVAAHGTELPPSEEFAKICQTYQHVQWHQMTWIDFCSQSSAELSEMSATRRPR